MLLLQIADLNRALSAIRVFLRNVSTRKLRVGLNNAARKPQDSMLCSFRSQKRAEPNRVALRSHSRTRAPFTAF